MGHLILGLSDSNWESDGVGEKQEKQGQMGVLSMKTIDWLG